MSARLEQEGRREPELGTVSGEAEDPRIYRAERRVWGRSCCSHGSLLGTATGPSTLLHDTRPGISPNSKENRGV